MSHISRQLVRTLNVSLSWKYTSSIVINALLAQKQLIFHVCVPGYSCHKSSGVSSSDRQDLQMSPTSCGIYLPFWIFARLYQTLSGEVWMPVFPVRPESWNSWPRTRVSDNHRVRHRTASSGGRRVLLVCDGLTVERKFRGRGINFLQIHVKLITKHYLAQRTHDKKFAEVRLSSKKCWFSFLQ